MIHRDRRGNHHRRLRRVHQRRVHRDRRGNRRRHRRHHPGEHCHRERDDRRGCPDGERHPEHRAERHRRDRDECLGHRFRERRPDDRPAASAHRERHRDVAAHCAAGSRTGCCPSAADGVHRVPHLPGGPGGAPVPDLPVGLPRHRRRWPERPAAAKACWVQWGPALPKLRPAPAERWAAPGNRDRPTPRRAQSELWLRPASRERRAAELRPALRRRAPVRRTLRPERAQQPEGRPVQQGGLRQRPGGQPVPVRALRRLAAVLVHRVGPGRRWAMSWAALPIRWPEAQPWLPAWSPGRRPAACGRREPRWSRTAT